MPDEYTPPPAWAVILGALAVALGLWMAWDLTTAPVELRPSVAAPVPTLMPTPALAVPTAQPVPPRPPSAAVYIENNGNGSVTIQQTNVDVNICISLDCR